MIKLTRSIMNGTLNDGSEIISKEELATLREKAAAFDELSGRRYFKFVHSGHHEYELSFDEEYFYGPSLIGCVNQAMKADSDKEE